jgi:branched-chain amino acid transport system permease protein
VIGGFGSIAGAIVGGYALGGLEVFLTAIPGIGDILPPGLVSPAVEGWIKRWLPSSLTSYRDAFVFVVLILVLLFRPNGIMGRREREEME